MLVCVMKELYVVSDEDCVMLVCVMKELHVVSDEDCVC